MDRLGNESEMNLNGYTRPLLSLGAALAGVGWYAWRIEPRWLRVTRAVVALPDLPPAFDGYRIAHVSDVHLGVRSNVEHLPVVVERVNREHADLIAITGDFATGRRDRLLASAPVLGELAAPGGAWAVLGNHDYYAGVHLVRALLDRAGINLLTNAHHVIARGADRLVLAGLDDVLHGIPDLNAALDGAPDSAPVVLMVHEPDYARIAAAEPRVRVQLSGHTHGGQVRLPVLGAPILPKLGHVYQAGRYTVGDGLALFVSRGTGTSQLVVRLNCRPEIAIITLRRESPGGPRKDTL